MLECNRRLCKDGTRRIGIGRPGQLMVDSATTIMTLPTPATLPRRSSALALALGLCLPLTGCGARATSTQDGALPQTEVGAPAAQPYPASGASVSTAGAPDDASRADALTAAPPPEPAPIIARFDRDAGRISGRAIPGPAGAVEVEVETVEVELAPDLLADPDAAPAVRVSALLDASGAFGVALPPGQALRGGRALTLTVRTRGDDLAGARAPIVIRRKVPFLRVSLHPGDIAGSGAPRVPVTIELRTSAGVLRGVGLARSDAEGYFRAWMRDGDGERVRPQPGDVVGVDAGDGPWSLVVPALTGKADSEQQLLAGTGIPGVRIDLTLWNPWRPGEYATPHTRVASDGAWSADPGVPIEPATHYYITEHLPSGDQVFHCEQLPRLHLEPGSPRVRVESLSDIDAVVVLERGGREAARAEGAELWSGELVLDLADGSGRPVPLVAGDIIRTVVNGESIDLTVPHFDAAIDAASNEVRGRTVPGWTVALAAPAPMPGGRAADTDGRFAITLDIRQHQRGVLSPGERFDAYAVMPEHHKVGRRFEVPEIVVDLDAAGAPAAGSPDLPDQPDLTLAFDPDSGVASGRGPAGEALELKVVTGRLDPGESLSAAVDPEGDWALDLRGMPDFGFRFDPAAVRRLDLRWTAETGQMYLRRWER